MTPFPVWGGAIAALMLGCYALHRRNRWHEEHDIVVRCSCGKEFDFVKFAGDSVLRRCSCGNTDIRLRADCCPDPKCHGHLAHLRDEACDHQTCTQYKQCDVCGRVVTFVMRLSDNCRRALKRLESPTAA